MILFKKGKDTILKITNIVLLIWLVSSITILNGQILDIMFAEEFPTYEEYELESCNDNKADYYYEPKESDCKSQYYRDKDYHEEDSTNNLRNLIVNIGNTLIVTGVLYMVNKGDKNV